MALLRSWTITLPLALCLGAVTAAAVQPQVTAVRLKSAFLYQFTHYAEWPDDALGSAGDPIAMCVSGRDGLAQVLEDAVRARRSRDRRLVVRRVAEPRGAAGCHLLFVGWTEPERIDAAIAGVDAQPTLTVGDVEGFARRGGMINLTQNGARLGVEINRRAVQRARIHLSSQLLKLAKLVEIGEGD